MDCNDTPMPPVCCILMYNGMDILICKLDPFGDDSNIAESESGYSMMHCEYYCALCNDLLTLLLRGFASFDLDAINRSRGHYQLI